MLASIRNNTEHLIDGNKAAHDVSIVLVLKLSTK